MALIDKVKPRIGVFYSTPEKDAEVQDMIDGAVAYLRGAGWDIWPWYEHVPPAAVDAIVHYCKMSMSTDPGAFRNSEMLIALAAQGRASDAQV